ncbi:MAG TPA: hypothetical protein VFX15_01750 [Actinomycetes bacterium]|nr:hypothetical protein [Actinomycetes bacterium]
MSDVTPPPPPPPPPPGQPPSGQTPASGGGNLEAGTAISYGWTAMTRYIGPFILIALVVVVVQVGLSFVGYAFDNQVLRIIWNIVAWAIGLIIAMGLIRAALAVLDGERPEVGMLFQTEGFVPYLIATILFSIAVGIGLILCVIPGLILAFLFAFYGYAIVDEKTGDGVEALKMSWQLVSQNVGQLLLLFILVILINIVGFLLLCVGLLFTYPIGAVAIAYAWRTMTGGRVAQLA